MLGLVLYAAVSGDRWLDVSGRGTHENFAALFLIAGHGGARVRVSRPAAWRSCRFAKTRPAAFQLWIGYAVLLVCWVAGGFL